MLLLFLCYRDQRMSRVRSRKVVIFVGAQSQGQLYYYTSIWHGFWSTWLCRLNTTHYGLSMHLPPPDCEIYVAHFYFYLIKMSVIICLQCTQFIIIYIIIYVMYTNIHNIIIMVYRYTPLVLCMYVFSQADSQHVLCVVLSSLVCVLFAPPHTCHPYIPVISFYPCFT